MGGSIGLFQSMDGDWRDWLAYAVQSMRELSRQTDPQAMSRTYAGVIRKIVPVDASLSLSRRDLQAPQFRITRSSRWTDEINPWKQKERLPVFQSGILSELIYGDEPRLFDDFHPDPKDPAFEYLDGYRSLIAIPMYDRGVALNMVILLRQGVSAFPPEQLPEMVWTSNLYGRATHSLVLSQQLEEAYSQVDYELQVVERIQRALLPTPIPSIPTLGVAAHYQTSRRAGGDYYDFFPLTEGKWGILIADVSGHGTPAAVIMAVTHSLAHTYPGQYLRPSQLLNHVNHHLYALYTVRSDHFVTAFYAIYDPANRTFTYSSAGHNPPRLKRCEDGTLTLLDQARGLPLGVFPEETYSDETYQLVPGDQLILYTDGITEAEGPDAEQFGLSRLDDVLENCAVGATDLLQSVLVALETFTAGKPAHDDRTLLVLKIS